MKKKSRSLRVTQRFIDWVYSFSKENGLFNESSSIAVGLSGGADSVLLLYFFKQLKDRGFIKDLRAFHLNHSTRFGQKQEQEFVESLCKKLSIDLITSKLPENYLSKKNFELEARKARYDFFYRNLKVSEKLALGHHLDDSFEWYLMSQFKSSNINILGIPVKNKKIIRPLMCMSKNQIKYILKLIRLEFIEDPTNQDISYERNFVRHLIEKSIANRYPKYLKHYVQRMKQIQQSSVTDVKKLIIKNYPDRKIIINPALNSDFSPYLSELKNIIHEMSGVGRGTIQVQLDKLIAAIKNQKTGPMLFSGNLYVFFDGHYLIMTKQKYFPVKKISFNKSDNNFQTLNLNDFKQLVLKNYELEDRPSIVAIQKEKYFGKDLSSLNEVKNFFKFEKNDSVVFQSANALIQKWENKKNLKSRKLKISFLNMD